MNKEILTLIDEDGNKFEGTEVLHLEIAGKNREDGKDVTIVVVQDDRGDLYPFRLNQDESVELVTDEDLLDTVEVMLSMTYPENDSET